MARVAPTPAPDNVLVRANDRQLAEVYRESHALWGAGLSYEDALAEAKTVGLILPAYEIKAKDYIERHQSK